MKWMEGLDEPSAEELKDAVIPKPSDFSGSKYPTEISTVRINRTPEFIEAAGAFLKPLLKFKNDTACVDINLQRTKDRDTQELTNDYALYLSIVEQGII